jgi:hypothetical protein
MAFQLDPALFNRLSPIYTVSAVDEASDTVTLSGPDGSLTVPLKATWSHIRDAWPLVGSKVQLLPD